MFVCCSFVCVYVCLPLTLLKTIHLKQSLNSQSKNFYCFLVSLYCICYQWFDGWGRNKEACHELLAKKGTLMLCLSFIIKAVYITNKIECFSFKSGHAMQVAKLIRED